MGDDLRITFSWYDYVLFGSLLSLSTAIGVYFGFFGKKQTTADEYLKGGKKMKVFPIAMSQISTHISGIMLLAVPADTYFYGFTFVWSLVGVFVVGIAMPIIYLPVFYKLQVTSIYEYLEARFNASLRRLCSLLFAISSFLYLPVVIYVPALAFAQATDVNLHLITPLVCAVCLFYTTVGGIKAVVWTDTLQFMAMVGGTVAVMVIGVKSVDGFGNIYEKCRDGQRLDTDTEFTMFKRDTVWSTTIGMSVHWMNNICVNQGTVQKFLALPKFKDINKALVIFLSGEFLIKTACIFIGLLIYTRYFDCDPYTTGIISKRDQLLPYFIMDVARDVPGLPGLFISGIFCAALSTLSAVMNSLGGTIYQDFIAPCMPKAITQKRVSNILKLLVFLIGIVATGLIFLVEKLGGLLPLVISFNGITGGALLGVFTLGLVVPFANSKGAMSGAIVSLILVSCLFFPAQWYRLNGYLKYEDKPLNVYGCTHNFTIWAIPKNTDALYEPPIIFKTSPFFYTMIGFLIVFMVGVPVSWFTNKNKSDVDPDLISPFCRSLLPNKDSTTNKNSDVYYSVDTALRILNKEL